MCFALCSMARCKAVRGSFLYDSSWFLSASLRETISLCLSNARWSSLFWLRTFFPLKDRRDKRMLSVCESIEWDRLGWAWITGETYIFWLNSSSLWRSLWLVEVKHGLYGFRGRIRPSGPICGAGGGGGGTPRTGAIMSFPVKEKYIGRE